MKQTDKMSRAVSQLEHMYNAINTDWWDGQLPTPIITVQSKPGTMGHCTTAKIWKRTDEEEQYEMNIAAEVLSYPIEETIDTLIHEMVHLYCRENNIKEVSRGGTYHNAKFKEIAEAHGCECFKAGQYGWNTRPSEKILEYALSKGWSEIRISRGTVSRLSFPGSGGAPGPAIPVQTGTTPSSSRKIVCPKCKNSCRVTKKEINIICGDCMERMV